MVAAPRIISHIKLFSGAVFTSRFSLVEGEADAELGRNRRKHRSVVAG
jgi:hypothetical protein